MFRVQSSTAFWKQLKPKNAKRATGEGVFGNSCYFIMKTVSHFRNFKGKFPFSLYPSTFVFVCVHFCVLFTLHLNAYTRSHTVDSQWEFLSVWVAQSCLTLCYPVDCSPPGSSVHGDSPGKNTGVGSHSLLQRTFPIQGSNPGLLHCRQILYCQSHQGSPNESLSW